MVGMIIRLLLDVVHKFREREFVSNTAGEGDSLSDINQVNLSLVDYKSDNPYCEKFPGKTH